jgi:hypothetical protein
MAAPKRDFAFSGIFNLLSCTIPTWSGGTRDTWKMAGPMRRVSYEDVILPTDEWTERRKEEPHEGRYRILFCEVAREPSDCVDSDIANIDRIRRAFEIYFSLVTNRVADTKFE